MFRRFRIAILLYILILVGGGAWLTSRDSTAARYYMSVHAAEPALDWSLAPPVPARSPEARVRSFSDALPASPNAGSRVPK